MGDTAPTAKGGTRPVKLETWRITSPSRALVEDLATKKGGVVEPWESPDGPQWEVVTDSDSIDVLIPPGPNALTQWYEMWSGGGCQRRCDGQNDQISGGPCRCPADAAERVELAKTGKACKPTTRLIVILPDAGDLGSFTVESHGYYAAVELGGTFDLLRMTAPEGSMLRGRLRIDQRSRIVDGKTTRYAVPVLETPGLSFQAIADGANAGVLTELEPPKVEQRALPAPEAPVTDDRASGGNFSPPRTVPLPPPELPAPEPRRPHVPVAPVTPDAPLVQQAQELRAGDGAREVNGAIGRLDEEHTALLNTVLASKGIDPADADAVGVVVAQVEKQQRATHLARQKRANAAMAPFGLDDDGRHQFVSDATGAETSSTAHLTQQQCDLICEAAQ